MITVNGDKVDWKMGMTIQDVLDAKNYSFRLISVWVDGALVRRREDYSATPVPDGCDIDVIHMMSGG
ncbi:MAG: sulfur carrier protein ThiS [Synergistaceae bacterium]|jgi:sulfur carrier protein|nr:sulfur carrier protein ThiS [Synergistaceae bacterium]